MVGDTFWNNGCFVLLCYREAVKILIRIEILVENISRFNMYGKVVICHYVLSFGRCKKSNKLPVVIIRWQRVICLNKVFIDTAIEKFNLVINTSFIKRIFYFLKTILFFDIFKDFIFKFFLFRNPSSKYPLPLVLIYLLDHLPVQVLEDHWAVHRFYHQVLFVLHFLFLLFLLLMFVFESHINNLKWWCCWCKWSRWWWYWSCRWPQKKIITSWKWWCWWYWWYTNKTFRFKWWWMSRLCCRLL